MPQKPPYSKTVYDNLKQAYGDQFNRSFEEFESKLSDPAYQKTVYDNLKQVYGDQFTRTEQEFSSLLKKKETSDPILQNISEGSQTSSRVGKSVTSRQESNEENKPVMVQPKVDRQREAKPDLLGKVDIEQRSSLPQTQAPKEFVPTPTEGGVQEAFKAAEPIVDRSVVEELKGRGLDQYTPTRSSQYNVKELVKQASVPMQPTASVESAKVETAMIDLEEDYLDYLEKTNPELAQYKFNEVQGIREKRRSGKELNTSEERVLRDFRNSAIEAHDSANILKIKEIKLSSDFETFNKDAAAIELKLNKVDREIAALGIDPNGQNPPDKITKAQGLLEQRKALEDEFVAVQERTGVNSEKIAEYDRSVKSLIGEEAMLYTDERYTDLKELEEKTQKELQDKLDRALKGEESGFKAGTQAFVGAVGRGITNLAKLPKVLGDAVGDNDYDAIDEMYYATDALQNRKEGMFGSIDDENLPASYVYSRMFGEGIGSVALLALPSNVLGATGNASRALVSATSFATSEADFYQEALSLGMNPKEAARSATAIAAITAAIEGVIPDAELFNSTLFARTAMQAMKEGGFREGMKQAIKNVPQKAADIFLTASKEGSEEALGQLGQDVTKEVINIIDPKGDKYSTFTPKSYTESFAGGFLVGGGLRVFSKPETAKSERSPLQEATLLDAVELKDGVMEQAMKIDAMQAPEVGKVLTETQEIYEGLKGAPSFEKLPKNMQAHVLSELQRKKVLEKGAKAIGIEDPNLTAQIEGIESEVKFVLENGKTPFEAKQEEAVENALPEEKPVEVELSPEVPVKETAQESTITEPIPFSVAPIEAVEETTDIVEETPAPVEETPMAETPAQETVAAEPKVGDTAMIEPQRKGGLERKMVFTEEGWQQEVGGNLTRVGAQVQQKANEAFLTASPAAETVQGEVAETPVKVEEAKVESPVNLEKNWTNEVFVHETDSDVFDSFNLDNVGSGQGDQWLGRGVYLQQKGSFKIENYGKNKIEARLKPSAKIFNVQNTKEGKYRDSFVEWAVQNTETGRFKEQQYLKDGFSLKNILPRDILRKSTEAVEKLKAEGYDGLYQDGELVIYNPDVLELEKKEPIISESAATENKGRAVGKEEKVKFTSDKKVPVKYVLIEADDLYPSHLSSGERNPMHQIASAQPKERNDAGSKMAQDKIASDPNLAEVGESPNAYFGAPIVNTRGEVIQGNNRSIGLKKHYKGNGTKYKSDLEANAEKFGFTKEQVAAMKNPILVREVDVNDQEAIELGQYDVKDLETGGKQRIDPIATSRKMSPADKSKVASLVFSADYKTTKEAIRANAKSVSAIIKNYINPAQGKNTFNTDGSFTSQGMDDVAAVISNFMFEGGAAVLPEVFDKLSYNIRQGIQQALPNILSVSDEKSLKSHVQNAMLVVYEFNSSEQSNFDAWSNELNLFTGGSPKDAFLPVELAIAKKLIDAEKQVDIKTIFKNYENLTTDKPADMFEEARDGLSKKEAIKQLFNVPYNENEQRTDARPQSEISGQGVSEPKKKSTGKEAAKAKVDELAEKLKEALRAKGIDDKNIQKFGVGEEIIDLAAKGVKLMIDTGFAVGEAITTVLDAWRSSLTDEQMSELEANLRSKYKEEKKVDEKEEKKEVKDSGQDSFKEAAVEAKGEKRVRGFAERAKAAGFGDVVNEEYDSTDREKANDVAQRLFDQSRAKFESGDEGIFDRVQETFLSVTLRELAESPQLAALYANFFHKVAYYFNQKGNIEKAGQFINLQAEVGTAAGTYAASLSAESTPEAIANRLFKEDKEREKVLQNTTKDGVSVKDVLKGLKESGKLSKSEIDEIVSVLDIKPKRTATTTAEKKENIRKKREDIKKRFRAKMGLGTGGAFQAIPEIIELAQTYIESGVVSLADLKSKVWSELKEFLVDGQKDVEQIIDDNSELFMSKIDENNQNKAVEQLQKAFEGKALEGDNLRKKAITIISEMILRNDPEYVSKRGNKERLKAKERLSKILKNRDAITSMVVRAKDAAISTVNKNSNLTDAEKQTMINAIEDVASGLVGMPVGMSNQRAASQSLNDKEVKAEIDRIVREHYENPTGEIKTLAQKLVEQLGVDPSYATSLQKQVEDKIAKKVQEKLDSKKASINNAIDSLGVKDATAFKKVMVRAISKGKTNDKQFFGELLTAMGVRGFSQEDAQKLKDLVGRLSVLDPSNEVYTEISKELNDILLKYDETTAAFVARWMQEQFFINALSDFVNTGFVNSGLGATLAFIGTSAKNIVANPKRYARALKYNRTLRKNGVTVGAASIGEKASNPMKNLGETTFVDKVTEAGHGAVQRATESQMRELLRKFKDNENNRRGYYLAQMVAKTFSHLMMSGKWPNSFKKIPFVKRGAELVPPPTMWSTAIMSVQDLFMGVVSANIETYIQTEVYLDTINKERVAQGLPAIKKGSKEWSEAVQELLPHSPEAIQKVKDQVNEELVAMANAGEPIGKGWAERRMRSLLRQNLPQELVATAAQNAEKALSLNNPEGLGAYVVALKNKYGAIKDTDNGLAFAKLIGNTALGFIRMTTVAAELNYRAVPVLGATMAIYGKKARLNKGRVEWINLTAEEKAMRYFENAVWSLALLSLVMSVFDWDEEEELDEKGKPTGRKIVGFRLAKDSPLSFFGDPVSEKERNKMEGLGVKPNSVSVYGKNIPLKFLGFQMGMLGKMIGEISDNVRYKDAKIFISQDGKLEKTNDSYWTPDMLAGLITSQAFSADYSTPVKASTLFMQGKFMNGIEALMLDGVETSFSPTLYENIKAEMEALQGIQATAKDDITDRILGDIFWTDMLIDKSDRKLYDHFGQPIPVKSKNYVVKSLIGEQMYAEGADHVKNSKYYKLFNEENKKRDPKDQWTPPKPYDPTEIFESGYIPDEKFAQEITKRVGETWAGYIDQYYEKLQSYPFEERVKVLELMRKGAIEIAQDWARETEKAVLPKKELESLYGDIKLSEEEKNEIRKVIGTR